MSTPAHFVQFYETDSYLIESLRDFVRDGLAGGEAIIVIATEAHRAALEMLLATDGVDLAAVRTRGQYVDLDAAETLSVFTMGGRPDRDLFEASIDPLVRQAAETFGTVRAFGEMVALLVEAGAPAAAIELEYFWNDLQAKLPLFTLFCAYPTSSVFQSSGAELKANVCDAHSQVIPHGQSPSGQSLRPLETTHTILSAAPREPQSLEFFIEIGKQFGVPPAKVESTLLTLEAAGEARRDHLGRWSARRG